MVHRGRLHRRLEDLEPALAAALGEVHRDVRVADELLGGPVVGAGDGHADAGPHRQAVTADVERLAQRRQDPLATRIGTVPVGAVRRGR